MLDIGTDVVDGPGRRIGVGDHPGNLRRDIRPLRDLGDLLPPWMFGAILDCGDAAMVENELHPGRQVG